MATASLQKINSSEHEAHRVEVAGWHIEKLYVHISVSVFLIAICVIKILYHKCPKQFKVVTTSIPESNILIIVGVISGIAVYFIKGSDFRIIHWSLNPDLFFYILLPPIMLESAYSLYDRDFFNNITSIIYFAVIGTVLNCLIIGFSLYAISLTPAMGEPKLNLSIDNSLLFSSIVVAVDPVAVLAIFNEIGVNPDLYYTVFGESLLNDAVTVVLYDMFNVFSTIKTLTVIDVVLSLISFLTVSFGGLLIGIISGAFCSFISRFTEKSQIIEPMVIFSTAVFSYYMASLVAWSGIMGIIGCGIMQAAYCFDNISRKSKTTVKYFSKVMASVSEGIIFLYLGVELVTKTYYWHWGFAMWSLTLCIVARFLVVFVSSTLMNIYLEENIRSYGEMFIISFGGLRGAVAFALSATLNRKQLLKTGIDKDLYVTTTLFIIMFTCFVMGLLIKPAVRLMKISVIKKDHQLSVFYELNNHIIDHIGTAVEEITGNRGKNYLHTKIENFSAKYIRPLLQRKVHHYGENIIDIYHKVAFEIHLATVELSNAEKDKKQRSHITDKLASNLKTQIDKYGNSFFDFNRRRRSSLAVNLTQQPQLSTTVDLNNEDERQLSMSELRAAMKVMTLSTPARRMSVSLYHEKVSRSQQNDSDTLAKITEQKFLLRRQTIFEAPIENEISDGWKIVRAKMSSIKRESQNIAKDVKPKKYRNGVLETCV